MLPPTPSRGRRGVPRILPLLACLALALAAVARTGAPAAAPALEGTEGSGTSALPGESAGPAAPSSPPGTDASAPLEDPELLARARAYTRGNYLLYLARNAVSAAFLALFVLSGASGRLWAFIRGRIASRAGATAVYVALFAALATAISLPLDFYDGFIREHAYGFSMQTPGAWASDQIKGLMVTIVLGSLFVVPLYAVIGRWPRSWWMMGAALGCAFAVFVVAVAPVFIAPLFNEFTPLKDRALADRILAMAHRNGIPAEDVFQMDASTRSSHDNAYVTGLLGTERIVLYDTLLEAYTPDEIAFVMGHEMGHYVLNHLWKGLGILFALIVSGFYLVDRGARWAIGRFRERVAIGSVAEVSSLPILLFILSAYLFVTLPIQSGFSRAMESQADVFGLRAIETPAAAPAAFRKMASRNLSDPDPPALVEWFLYSHPSMGKRIRRAEAFAAEAGRSAGSR